MSINSAIEWTDATWNPVRGCSMAKGSETGGCLNCYAARDALRRPETGLAVLRPSGPRWTGKVEIVEKHLADPLHWRTPRRIFVNSLSDLFHESLSDEVIDRVFAVMALCPQHTFQVLTKRPERMLAYLGTKDISDDLMLGTNELDLVERWGVAAGNMLDGPWIHGDGKRFRTKIEHFISTTLGLDDDGEMLAVDEVPFPLPNVWLGTSVEDQKTADARIPVLLQTLAAKRFISYEPALGPVDFREVVFDLAGVTHDLIEWRTKRGEVVTRDSYENYPKGIAVDALTGGNPAAELPGLDWIIVGGESGPGARTLDIAWARQTIQQCREADVACFVKQLGAKPVVQCGTHAHAGENCAGCPHPIRLKDRKGGDMAEWPEDLRVRQFPGVSA